MRTRLRVATGAAHKIPPRFAHRFSAAGCAHVAALGGSSRVITHGTRRIAKLTMARAAAQPLRHGDARLYISRLLSQRTRGSKIYLCWAARSGAWTVSVLTPLYRRNIGLCQATINSCGHIAKWRAPSAARQQTPDSWTTIPTKQLPARCHIALPEVA